MPSIPSRISTPTSIATSPEPARPLLKAVEAQMGSVPNMFRLVATSPAALEGFLGLNSALSKGTLDTQTRTRIAMTVSELNRCSYCLSAHTFIGKNLAQLGGTELADNQASKSSDLKAGAALVFAAQVVRKRGQVSELDLQAVKSVGYSDAEIVEIIAHVALNTFSNYLNNALGTEIDFPLVEPAKGP